MEAVFLRDYGPQVRFVPAARGLGLLAWLLPGIAVLAGAAAWLRFVRRRTAAAPSRPPAAAAPSVAPPVAEDDPVIAARLRDYL